MNKAKHYAETEKTTPDVLSYTTPEEPIEATVCGGMIPFFSEIQLRGNSTQGYDVPIPHGNLLATACKSYHADGGEKSATTLSKGVKSLNSVNKNRKALSAETMHQPNYTTQLDEAIKGSCEEETTVEKIIDAAGIINSELGEAAAALNFIFTRDAERLRAVHNQTVLSIMSLPPEEELLWDFQCFIDKTGIIVCCSGSMCVEKHITTAEDLRQAICNALRSKKGIRHVTRFPENPL